MKQAKLGCRTDFDRWGRKWYVASLPGRDDKHSKRRSKVNPRQDWGYTVKIEQAMILTPYWQRRLKCDAERVGHVAYFENTRATCKNDHAWRFYDGALGYGTRKCDVCGIDWETYASGNIPCSKCGRTDVDLHTDGQCGYCGPKAEGK